MIENNKWEIQYLGANQDAFAVGSGLGVRNNVNFGATNHGLRDAYNSVSAYSNSARRSQSKAFAKYQNGGN